VQVVKRPAHIERAPLVNLLRRHLRQKLLLGFAERQGEDVEEPRLATLG
jgi:hypothetical protein